MNQEIVQNSTQLTVISKGIAFQRYCNL